MTETLSSNSATAPQRVVSAIVDNGCLYEYGKKRGTRANYAELINVIKERMNDFWPNGTLERPVHLCTSAPTSTDARFAQFTSGLEEIGFNVYTAKGPPAYVKDLRGFIDFALPDRVKVALQRQDALMGYLIGRLVESHDLVVISDSAGVLHTLTIAAMKRRSFGILMAPRSIATPSVLEGIERSREWVHFVDLDADAHRLFSSPATGETDVQVVPKI